MRRPIVIALALLVVLPLALLVWFATQMAASEQAAIDHRVRSLVDAQLAGVDTELAGLIRAHSRTLAALADTLPVDTDVLRRFARESSSVRQVLVMAADGGRLHPPADALLDADEREFLARTRRIWLDRELLYQESGTAPIGPAAGLSSDRAQTAGRGWYVWHWGDETVLIYWQRAASGGVIGFELEPVRLLADMIVRLPATGRAPDVATLAGAERIQLIDNRNTLVYQWGAYTPTASARPLSVRALSHPLASWQLSYYSAPLAPARQWLLTGLLVLTCAAALVGLALFLYREHSREASLARQRINFVNQVSHELKTPLTNIRMYAELLADQLASDDDKPRDYLQVIVAESQRLARLITNVLSFTSLQRNQLQLHYRLVSLDDIVQSALAASHPALNAKGIICEFVGHAATPVNLDPDVVEQIVNNLLSNVEKYAAEGGRAIIATGQHEDGRVWVSVRDFGPGIARRERRRIFQPFYRISSELSDGVAGTGIGLTITRELARRHGGELRLCECESGACFEVALLPGTLS